MKNDQILILLETFSFTTIIPMFLFSRNTLRVTRSAALKDTSTSGNNNTYLGKRNKDFAFADLKPIKVEFAECSALGKDENSEPDIGQIEDWLMKVA